MKSAGSFDQPAAVCVPAGNDWKAIFIQHSPLDQLTRSGGSKLDQTVPPSFHRSTGSQGSTDGGRVEPFYSGEFRGSFFSENRTFQKHFVQRV